MTDAEVSRSTSSERTRIHRERRRAGSTLIRLIISAEGANELVRLGWLCANLARDPVAVADALLAIAGDAAGKGLRPPRAPARVGVR